jgi:hypothetical protein
MFTPILLSRDDFRRAVLARDHDLCVMCGAPAADAHHILERRLWPDGGYYLENGASVCSEHHLACERTTISVEAVREAAKITRLVIPPHLYSDQPYDKWGNPLLANGQRLKGELFFDESVQKALSEGGALALFTPYVKYPRTHHLPWSEGVNDDDRVMPSLDGLIGQRVVATEKVDGENTTLYRNYSHARSVDGRSHPSRDWVKQFASRVAAELPDDWRLCGENLYARHSIGYNDLPSYFLGFSIWTERNIALAWDDTLEWFALLGVTPVPILYDGVFDEAAIKALWRADKAETTEGYVVRTAGEISYGQFRHRVGKFVRHGHVQTTKHWMRGQPLIKNQMRAINTEHGVGATSD